MHLCKIETGIILQIKLNWKNYFCQKFVFIPYFLEYPAHFFFSEKYKSKIAVRSLFEIKLAGLVN
ncbi:hypothetical protein C0J52_04921 [Blattella germanica]|nr:hypothetical protein C0J52_04921 [Blattella germanica]